MPDNTTPAESAASAPTAPVAPKRKKKKPAPKKLLVIGDKLKSRMLRVDAGFADWVQREARRRTDRKRQQFIRATDITRELLRELKERNR